MKRGWPRASFAARLTSLKNGLSSWLTRHQYQQTRIDKKRANRDKIADKVVVIDEEKDKRDFIRKANSSMVNETYEQVG